MGFLLASAVRVGMCEAQEEKSAAKNPVSVVVKRTPRVQAERSPSALVSQQLHPDEKTKSQEVTGTVSYADNNGIAVEYGPSAEIYLKMSSAPKLSGFRSLKDLQLGDPVRVKYETVYKENSDQGQKTNDTILKMTAVEISLMKPVKKGLP